MQYSWFSVISGCPYKTVQPCKKYLAVLPRHTLYKVETEKNSGFTRPSLFVGGGGGELGMCDLKRAHEMQMECPRLLSMIESTNATIWQ